MDSCSKCWGNLEGIWGNPGEIPHIGWKIPGVYRVKSTLLLSKVIDVDHQNSCLFTNKGHFSSPLWGLIGVLAQFYK